MAAYDYLVVGSGLYGAVFARQATDAGKKVSIPGDSEPSFRKHSTVNPLWCIPQFWELNTAIPVK